MTELTAAVTEAEVAVGGEAEEGAEITTHVASGKLADLRLSVALHRFAADLERWTLMHPVDAAGAEAMPAVALGPDLCHNRGPAHRLADGGASHRQADQCPRRDPAANPVDAEELVTDPLDPPLDQIHLTHEHLEDVATRVVRPLRVAAEAHQGGEDGRTRVRGRLPGQHRVAEDEVVEAGAVAEEDHVPTRPMAGHEEVRMLLEAALREMTVV